MPFPGKFWSSALLLAALLITPFATVNAQTTTINVSSVSALMSAVSTANSAGGNRTILVADGTYTLTDTLYINAPNITIAGASSARDKVIIQGDAMSDTAQVGSVIRVAGNNFQLHDVTLQKSRWHLIQIAGETNNADGPIIRNCILRDANQQIIKVSNDASNRAATSDNGLVENCLFEYTAGIGPQYYIGGIDAHGSKGWTVRGNTFRNIISPSTSVAEFAVHFWDQSANNIVERNTIVNCDRGIGFGLQNAPNSAGIIRNNMIYHAANKGSFADVAIALAESPNTQVYNNSIYDENYQSSIEYRFASTTGVQIINNLANKPLQARDGGTATTAKNVTNASASWFAGVTSGNLHLASAVSSVVDQGQAVSGLTNDFDGQTRPQGAGIDIGADEYGATVAPNPPTNVTVQ